jgi:hypothetical protein
VVHDMSFYFLPYLIFPLTELQSSPLPQSFGSLLYHLAVPSGHITPDEILS